MTEELSRRDVRRRRKRKIVWNRAQAIGILFLVVLLPILVFGVAPVAMDHYDSSHQVTVKCHVENIYSESTSSRSAKGIGSSSRQIIFDAPDCGGHLILQKGVYWDNVEELTDSLKADRDYELKVGEIEWKLAPTPIYRWTKLSPQILGYEYAAEDR